MDNPLLLIEWEDRITSKDTCSVHVLTEILREKTLITSSSCINNTLHCSKRVTCASCFAVSFSLWPFGFFVSHSLTFSSSVKFFSFSKFNFNFSIMDDPLLLSERTGSPLKTPALFTFSPRSSAALDATYVRGSRILSRQNYIYITSYSHTLTTHTYITLEPQAKN